MLRDMRAIIFDLDGTLVDSLADIATHLNDALVDRELPTRSLQEIGEWVGHGAEQLVARAVPTQDLVAPVLESFRARYRSRPVLATRLYPGLDVVLDTLAGRYQLAVLSNKPHDLTVEVVRQVCSRWSFSAIVGQRPGRPRKPDPDALRGVACELRIEVTRCVLVGDSEVDVTTARAAGAPSVGVSWGLRPLAVLRDARPDVLVHTPAELAQLFV